MVKNDIIVSICCTTYNHEKFIRDAIDGFLMQKTTFPIEIIIHDDASTDGTADIIREYEKKYPELIKPIYQKENQYSKGKKPLSNYMFPKCAGKYIAFCEGDDYWVDPYKLQKQVAFMEANEDYILCFTDCKWVDEGGVELCDKILQKTDDATYTHLDVTPSLFAPTLTRVFRNKYLDILPSSFEASPGGDAYLLFWHSKFGKIKYLNFVSAAYRVTRQGVWSGQNSFGQRSLLFETGLAILDIAEGESLEQRVHCLFALLALMKNEASAESESLKCRTFYCKLCQCLKNSRNSKRISWLVYARWRLFLVIYYHMNYALLMTLKKCGVKKVVSRLVGCEW